jgi:hypothetical protein
MPGEDILSVIFLALICIVISGIVMKLAPDHAGLIVPSFVFICISLWVAYDYMMLQRYKAKEHCAAHNKHNQPQKNLEQLVDDINFATENATDKDIEDVDNKGDTEIQNKIIPEPKKQNVNEYDIDLYHAEDNIRKLYTHMGADGDNQVCNRMKYMGVQAKLSQDIRASFNKYSWQPYLEEEMREGESKIWWDFDQLDLHT